MLQKTMWTFFRPTFQKNLSLLGVKDGRTLMSHAKKRFEQILKGIPEYGENDVLLVNLLSAAMFQKGKLTRFMRKWLEQKPPGERHLCPGYIGALLFCRKNGGKVFGSLQTPFQRPGYPAS